MRIKPDAYSQTDRTEFPPKSEAAVPRLGNEPIHGLRLELTLMIMPWMYDGHHCRIEEHEHEHEGYVVYDGYVDNELICRDELEGSRVRRAIAMWINNATDHAIYTPPSHKKH